ncbi:DUF6634 family protein [Rhizobium laguerreae]|uniref:DUF6634 family protein n=1 Tax=Rhizobium laguerreae TaxID=1076926 RepID=UPI001C924AD0|nr:DUF6634 family protein [Rhizobium laguerreae]MBY3314763.1 hypothetical protein [Rhizobium laguerreae]
MTDLNAVFNVQPSAAELASAPFIKAWTLKARPLARFGPQLWGWVYGHPTVGEGNYAHSSPVVAIDLSTPPRWARTESRLYRLGDACGPVEWEIRLLARSLKIHGERTKQDDIDDELDCNNPAGGFPGLPLDEAEQMIVNMRRFRQNRVTPKKLNLLWNAYRAEKYPPSPEDLARWDEEGE